MKQAPFQRECCDILCACALNYLLGYLSDLAIYFTIFVLPRAQFGKLGPISHIAELTSAQQDVNDNDDDDDDGHERAYCIK